MMFVSLRRRALAPLAWLTRLAARRRGRAGRVAARPGPVHIPHVGVAGRSRRRERAFHWLIAACWPKKSGLVTGKRQAIGALLKLVTIFGGTGFLGRHIVQRLAREGWGIRVATRRPELAGFLRPCGDVGSIVPIQPTYATRRRSAALSRAWTR